MTHGLVRAIAVLDGGAKPFENGVARVRKGHRWLYVDKFGKTVFDDAGAQDESLSRGR